MSTKLKIEIKNRFTGKVLFEYEKEDNNIRETVKAFLAAKAGEMIEEVDLSGEDLSGVDFSGSRFDNSRFYNSRFDNSRFDNSRFDNSSFDNSSFDNSRFDNSRFYNSRFDNQTIINIRAQGQLFMFDHIKHAVWAILLMSQAEISGLKAALKEGRINGSAYEGKCACLKGTIANLRGCNYKSLIDLRPDENSPEEVWFKMIKIDDTPETSEISKLTLEWIEQFEFYLKPPADDQETKEA